MVAAKLVDISSQHEHHSLVDPTTHLGFLDAFAGLTAENRAMAVAWSRLTDAEAALASLQAALREDRADWLRFQLAELDRVAGLDADEAEVSRLRNVDTLATIVGRAEDRLYGGEAALSSSISRVATELEGAARFDAGLSALAERLRIATTEIEDVAGELARYARGLRPDPARLAAIEESLHELRRLRRKHGDDLAGAAAGLRVELARFDEAEDAMARASAEIAVHRAEVARLVPILRLRREKEASRLAQGITAELASLGMGEARVDVEVAPTGAGPRGADRVEFRISTNRGEEPRPLRKVASGGELSRALLAVKRVLAAEGPVGAYVFDEVDSGVGGAIAEVIGGKLHAVSRHHQVLCITHLPQIAAWADRHLHVSKANIGDRTVSAVRQLSSEESIEELARMLGGVRISEAARSAARELRSHAHPAALR
jgi:DNA repair protein RecN (Recombination protein N)